MACNSVNLEFSISFRIHFDDGSVNNALTAKPLQSITKRNCKLQFNQFYADFLLSDGALGITSIGLE